MARNFRELQAKLSPEVRADGEAWAKQVSRQIRLEALRATRKVTQVELAEALGIQQTSVSKIERRSDVRVSTLRHYVEALGGKLEVRAVFPDEVVSLDVRQLEERG